MRSAGIVLTLLLGVGATTQAGSSHLRAPEELVLSGSTTMAPLMAAIARRFEQRHPGTKITVRMGGSSNGISEVRSNAADIGMVSRSLNAGEQDLYNVAIARDGVALIVHRSNPAQALSDAQLLQIYHGKLNNWSKAGGPNGAIHVLAGTVAGGSTSLMVAYLELPFEQFAAARKIGPNEERIAAVAADPLAIEYVSVGEAERAVHSGSQIKLLAIGGIQATSAEVRAGRYPIARPLLLVGRTAPTGAAQQFIEFCLSQQVSDLIAAYDFVAYQD
jgi:phosphate transport system substrate-binding protein